MWSCREDALLALYQKLMEIPVGTQKEDLKNMLRASVFLIRRAIKDIVTSVSPSACCPQVIDITDLAFSETRNEGSPVRGTS